MRVEAKILHEIVANQFQRCIKRILHYNQVGFISSIQGWCSILKSINKIHHIKILKKRE